MSRPTFPTYKGAEVEYGGRIFETVALTRSQLRKLEKIESELDDLSEETADDLDSAIEVLCKRFDIITVPTGGGKKTLGAYVRDDWHADKITHTAILLFSAQIDEIDPFGEPSTDDSPSTTKT